MASTGKELLGEHYGEDHLSAEQIAELDPKVVTEDGRTVGSEELRGKIFRIVDRDEYVVRNMETTGTSTRPCATCRRPLRRPSARYFYQP